MAFVYVHTNVYVGQNYHGNNKRNTVNSENITNKKVLLTYEKSLLSYKKDLFPYTKKDLLTNTNDKIPTANSHGKFLRQILMANLCGKFPRQTLEYVKQKMVWSILCVGELHM